jgi:hypothetical protein
MKQSNVIFATLIFSFILYVTMRGQLPAYLDLFKPKSKDDKSTAKQSPLPSIGDIFGKDGSPATDIEKQVGDWTLNKLKDVFGSLGKR